MRIDISNIIKIDGASLNIEAGENAESINLSQEGFTFVSPILFKGVLLNISGVLKLEGRLETDYCVKCNRCLTEVKQQMDFPVKEEFMDIEKNEDSECYTYNGNFVELDKVLKDNIILNLPIKLLCNEACKGICPGCGSDLNLGDCGCVFESHDPRFEALKGFFDKG
ncbi:MAG: DUF177 domain-containing protein [Clostridia bacterium]|nr:DUF177 domain-containing protein [Clostridia bacterium]